MIKSGKIHRAIPHAVQSILNAADAHGQHLIKSKHVAIFGQRFFFLLIHLSQQCYQPYLPQYSIFFCQKQIRHKTQELLHVYCHNFVGLKQMMGIKKKRKAITLRSSEPSISTFRQMCNFLVSWGCSGNVVWLNQSNLKNGID